MIITRTPFRVSFLGGGTDIPWFSQEYGGCVISTAIDRHMYLSAHPLFEEEELLLKYSKTERVKNSSEIEHPIFREALSTTDVSGLDISVSADFPAGTGLGSSSAFTVGLLNLLNAQKGINASKSMLAEAACELEIRKLQEPIGKQDQYASAYGGFNYIEFQRDGAVQVSPIITCNSASEWLSNSMILVWEGGKPRSASAILRDLEKSAKTYKNAIEALRELADLTRDSVSAIQNDVSSLGPLLKESWALKKKSNPSAISQSTEELIDFGIAKGALGAKLLGAGGTGFVLFLVEPSLTKKFLAEMRPKKAHQVAIDETGSTVIYSNVGGK